jgi:hypothetical protein
LETMTIFQNIYGFCQRQLGTYYWFNKWFREWKWNIRWRWGMLTHVGVIV